MRGAAIVRANRSGASRPTKPAKREDRMVKHIGLVGAFALLFGLALPASAAPLQVGTSFPDDFPVIENFYLGKPVIGFGSDVGRVSHVPVIFLHGNNDSPFPTACNPFGHIHDFAQFFLDNGYRPSELWGLGYQGDQCDLLQDQTHRSSVAHSTAAAVPLLRQFVHAVVKFTGAKHVDIIAHSLGVTVAREWMLQDNAFHTVRALIAVDRSESTRLNSSHSSISYAVFCLKKKKKKTHIQHNKKKNTKKTKTKKKQNQ